MKKIIILLSFFCCLNFETIDCQVLQRGDFQGSKNDFSQTQLEDIENDVKSIVIGLHKDSICPSWSDEIIRTVEIGKQIYFQSIETLDADTNPDIIFSFSFNQNTNLFSWSLYDLKSKVFLKKAEYRVSKRREGMIKTIANDIWKEIFNEESPFKNEICFLITFYEKNKNGFLEHKTKIISINPFFKESQKTILQIKSNILDLSSYFDTTQILSKLLFSLELNGRILLMELRPFGTMKKLFSKNEMIISPSISVPSLSMFYIKSGYLYYRSYDDINKTYKEQRIGQDNDYVSVFKIPEEDKIIVAKGRSIYLLNYQFSLYDPYKIINVSGRRIASKKSKCGSISYNFLTKEIIVSEKINGYYQLVGYQANGERRIITYTSYSKHDPFVSKDGYYIVYVAHMPDTGDRYLEMVNCYTRDIIKITDKPGLYRFPVWVTRKI